jgi:hypothetical protein
MKTRLIVALAALVLAGCELAMSQDLPAQVPAEYRTVQCPYVGEPHQTRDRDIAYAIGLRSTHCMQD